jgi:hypothetical protein
MKKIKKPSTFIFGAIALMLVLVVGGSLFFLLSSPGSNASPQISPIPSPKTTPFFPGKPTPVPNPTSGPHTYARLNQYSSQLPNNLETSIILVINLTVVPGQDLITDKLVFSLLPNGSSATLLPQLSTPQPTPTPIPLSSSSFPVISSLLPLPSSTPAATFDPTLLTTQSFEVSFAVPATSNGGVFVVTLASNNTELFRQPLAWMNKSP